MTPRLQVEVLISHPANFCPSSYTSMLGDTSSAAQKTTKRTKTKPSTRKSEESSSSRRPKSGRKPSQRKNEVNSALERLKRKRAKLPEPSSQPEEYASASEHDSLFSGSESDASSDFIVPDDGDGSLVAVLPKEFQAQDDLHLQLKKILQFMVHVAVRPPKERETFMKNLLEKEEYFSIPLLALRRRMSGHAEALKSLRWSSTEITRRLERYPDLEVQDVSSKTATRRCDLCKMKGKRACRFAQLSGFPYEKVGFEECDCAPDDLESYSYNLGSVCAKRCSAYHRLIHWEYALFLCVRREVDQLHEAAQANRIVNDRDISVPIKYQHLGAPTDLQDADGITQWLVDRNFVKLEGERIKQIVAMAEGAEKAARNGKAEA
ncbi:hypothetical protein C8F01DRAFT_1081866 [Mycena amicta]|nr:hypothetical protein C8F01DRAFT_1081866 [Mycena amicta]